MFLDEAADLCQECHRLAPFCNFNGNTFAALARSLVDTLKPPMSQRCHVIVPVTTLPSPVFVV